MMKKAGLAVSLALALGTSSAFAADIRIGTEGAYAPWNFMGDDGKVAGFEIELGNNLCERAGLSCEWVVNEWDSIIPNLLAGNYDMIMAGMSITDERMETIDFSVDYFPPDPSRYAGAAGTKLDFDNLKDVKIGVQGATIQAAYAESTFSANNTILSYETGDQAIADLMSGNIDILLADGSFLEPVIKSSEGVVEFIGPDVTIGGGVGIGLRKDDTDLQQKMADGIF
jgi:polar amino acid transport system substrate-binding protein